MGAGCGTGTGAGAGTDTGSGSGCGAGANAGAGLGELSHPEGSKTKGNIEGFPATSGRAAGEGGRGTDAGSAQIVGSVRGNRVAV